MKIAELFVLYFSLFVIINFLFIKQQKYKNIILLIFLFVFSFNLSLGHEQIFHGELMKVQMHSVVIALVCCLLMVINKRTFTFGLETLYFLPTFVFYVIDYFFRINNYMEYFSIVFTFLSIFLLFRIYQSFSYINLENIFSAISYLAIINGILSIAQFVTGKKLLIGEFNIPILYTQGVVDANRAIGLAGTNNSAGNFAAILLGVVLFNFLKRKNMINFFALLLTLIGSALSFTRIGYLGIVVELFVFVLFYRNKTKKGKVKKILLILYSFLFSFLILYIFSSSIINTLFTKRGDTTSSRFDQYKRIFVDIIPNHWIFGVGTGQYRTFLFNTYGLFDIDIHSQYLNTLAEGGLFIFILFVGFNIWIIFKILRSQLERSTKILGFSIFTANIICSNFNPNEHYYLVNILYYLIMFAILFKARQLNNDNKRIRSKRRFN